MKNFLMGVLASVMSMVPPGPSLDLDNEGFLDPELPEIRAVGNWNEFGYRLFDGPYINFEIDTDRWVDYPNINHMIVVLADGRLRYAEVVSWEIRTIETPYGPVQSFYFILNLYPYVWFGADDGFIYGKKIW